MLNKFITTTVVQTDISDHLPDMRLKYNAKKDARPFIRKYYSNK